MRIAIIRREPSVAFSMDVYANNLVSELKAIRPDWEIIEVAPQPWSKDLENLWHSGNPLLKYYERFFNHPRTVSKIDADVFHIIDHTNAHVAYWLKKLGKPVIITCHDLVQYVYPEILKNQSRFPALSMAMWQYSVKGIQVADHIIAVSTNTAKDISSRLHVEPKKVAVIANGVESDFCVLPSDVVAQWRSQYSKIPEEICVLNVGSTHQRKNIITVLQVIKKIADSNTPICLWKISDDFTKEQKQFIEENNLQENITFIGKCNRDSLIKFYNAADVLLAPSLYEGFGLTILEAMACGTPVITSNVSSLPEVAGNAAILVEPLDVNTIAKTIINLKKDLIFYKSLINSGLNRIQLFGWRKNSEQTAKLYENFF